MIYNGTYTITGITGEHRTFRIRTQPLDSKFVPGQRVLSLLTGSDNENDYTGFAFVLDTGIKVWKSRTGVGSELSLFDKYAKMIWSLSSEGESSGYYKKGCRLLTERTCIRCNRKLTHPSSIEAGIGPECAGRV